MLASDEPIQWHKVTALLPLDNKLQDGTNVVAKNKSSRTAVPPSLNRWSWGGFFFGWLWAVTNRIYWPLIVFIPVVGWFAIPIVHILLGVNGNKWAWSHDKWESVDAFERVQYTWAKAAAILFIAILASGILLAIYLLAFAGSILSMF